MIKESKPKTCKECKQKFIPLRPLQTACSYQCAILLAKVKEKKKTEKETRAKKLDLRTKSEWMKIAQGVFNKYIRTRDERQPCISCGNEIKGNNSNASHFYSSGGHSNLRFNEDNVHKSCIQCNMYLSGNLYEYSLRLPERIGEKKFEELKKLAMIEKKWELSEIKEIIEKYKNKTK
jgi:hypothetical protein